MIWFSSPSLPYHVTVITACDMMIGKAITSTGTRIVKIRTMTHKRYKSTCKDCEGGGICEHKRRRSKCKDCGGGSICEHQRERTACKDCGGSAICNHRVQRSNCKDCKGGSICSHNRVRSYCKDCGGTSICIHRIRRSNCYQCNICEHGLLKPRCGRCFLARRMMLNKKWMNEWIWIRQLLLVSARSWSIYVNIVSSSCYQISSVVISLCYKHDKVIV